MMSVIESHIAGLRCRERLRERKRQREQEKAREREKSLLADRPTESSIEKEKERKEEETESVVNQRIRLYLGVRDHLHLPFSQCNHDVDLFSHWSNYGIEVIPVYSRRIGLVVEGGGVDGEESENDQVERLLGSDTGEESTYEVEGDVISYSELMAMFGKNEGDTGEIGETERQSKGYRIGYVQDILEEDGIPSPLSTGALLCGQR
jgi:hypothetical protein